MTWLQEKVELLVAPFSELQNILALGHKTCLKKVLIDSSIIPDG